MTEYAVQVASIAIGIAILIVLLVITFKIGSWSNRLAVLEAVIGPYITKVDTIDKNVAILLSRKSDNAEPVQHSTPH